MFDSEALCRVLFEELELPARSDFALAYSGGRDSHVLLHALCAARLESDFTLTALHFDHGLARQSAEWARQCEAVCRQWQVAFVSHRQPLAKAPGESLEAQARQSRYRWFSQTLKPGQVLLTAHHANDQAETVLLNLLRGGGVRSLAGIPQQRVLSAEKSTRVARPLRSFGGEALAEYARRHQLSWIEDPSNHSLEFARNRLRESVIPLLEQHWPGAIRSLGNAAENCRAAAGFIDEMTEPLLQRCEAASRRGVFCRAPPLDGRALKSLGRFQILALLRHWIHRHGRRSPSSGQLETLFRQVFEEQSTAAKSASVCWDQSELRYFNEHLYLISRLADKPHKPVEWDLRECDLGNNLRIEIHEGGDLDPQQLRGKALQLVWRSGGERMTLPGRKHGSELKKLFQQHAVPPWERDSLPLLVADGEVAWAHGVGAGAVCHTKDHGDNEGIREGIRLRFVAGGD